MTYDQVKWMATFDRETGALSTYAARECGVGDPIRLGYVTNRGPETMPDLFITEVGRTFLRIRIS